MMKTLANVGAALRRYIAAFLAMFAARKPAPPIPIGDRPLRLPEGFGPERPPLPESEIAFWVTRKLCGRCDHRCAVPGKHTVFSCALGSDYPGKNGCDGFKARAC